MVSAHLRMIFFLIWIGLCILGPFCHAQIETRQVLLLPENNEAPGLLESISFALESVDKVEIVPFDISMKVQRSVSFRLEEASSFREYMGVDILILGKVEKHEQSFSFKATIFGSDQKTKNIAINGESSIALVQSSVEKICKELDVPFREFSPFYTSDARADQLYDEGLNSRNQGNFARATSMFATAFEHDPQFVLALLRQLQGDLVTGDVDLVEDALSRQMGVLDGLSNAPIGFRIEFLKLKQLVSDAKGERITTQAPPMEAALALARSHGLKRRAAGLLQNMAESVQYQTADESRSMILIEQARKNYRDMGDRYGEVEALLSQARVEALEKRDQWRERARARLAEAATLMQIYSYPQHVASADYIDALVSIRGATASTDLKPIMVKLERAERVFQEIGSLYSFIYARFERAELLASNGAIEDAKKILSVLLKQADDNGLFITEIRLRHTLASILFREGASFEAAMLLGQNLTSLGPTPNPHLARNAYNKLVPVFLSLGRYESALEASTKLLALADQEGFDRLRLSFMLNNHGEILFLSEDYVEARRYFERSLEIKRELGHVSGIAWTLRNLASLLIEIGELDQARVLIDEGEQLDPDRLANDVLLAYYQAAKGDYAAAIATIQEIRETSRWTDGLDAIFQTFEEAVNTGVYVRLGKILPNHL